MSRFRVLGSLAGERVELEVSASDPRSAIKAAVETWNHPRYAVLGVEQISSAGQPIAHRLVPPEAKAST